MYFIFSSKIWIRLASALFLVLAATGQPFAQSPSFTSTPVTTVQFDETYQYTVQTSDPNSDVVTVVATSLPGWLSITNQPTGLVTTFAGSGSGTANGTGTAASFNDPHGMVLDSHGNLFVIDQDNHRIRKISPDGVVSGFVGLWSGYDDGLGIDARFRGMRGIAIDGSDNLFIADQHRIRKVTPNGLVTTIAGSSGSGYADGTGTNALFNVVHDLDLDSQGNLYVADYFNNRIRKVSPEGIVSTFAGSGSGTNRTGTGTQAAFWLPQALAIDASDNIYVGTYISSRIYKISTQAVVTDFLSASFVDRANDLAFDNDGNLYIGDQHRVRKRTPEGVLTIIAGNGSGSTDGTGTTALFKNIGGVAVDRSGNVYVADENHRIRKINAKNNYLISGDPANQEGNHSISLTASDGNGGSAFQSFSLQVVVPRSDPSFVSSPLTSVGDDLEYQYAVVIDDAEQGEDVTVTAITKPSWLSFNRTYDGVVTTIAGGGTGETGNGTGTNINIGSPGGITIDSKGNLYFISQYDYIVKKVTQEGVVTTFAGALDPSLPNDADGTGTSARFSRPVDLTIDNSDNIYVADESSDLIRKISPEGVVSTFIGVKENNSNIVDGTGSEVRFRLLRAIDIDASGNVYVIDDNVIRKITQQGVATTLAGGDYAERDGQGTEAAFSGITALTVDHNGNVYVAGTGSKRIRKITPSGLVTTLAGYYGAGTPLDGTGTEATFSQPYSLTTDLRDNIYVLDNIWLRRITPEGVVSTLVGGSEGFADGTGTQVAVNRGRGLVADKNGNIYISDTGNRRIRKMTTAGWILEGDPRNQLGTHVVNLKVDDGDGGTANQNFTITVSDTSPPDFSSGQNVDFAENKVGTVYTILASDSNPSNTVVFSLGSEFDESRFSLISTGELIFKTPPDFENPTDADANNTYLVEVKASDGNNVASQIVVITVTNESDIDPVFTSTPVTSVNEGEAYSYEITTADGDDDYMIVSGNNLPGWLSINTTDWVVSTLAGAGTSGLLNGTGSSAEFNNPYGLVTDSQGNIYVVENGNHTIRKVSADGVVTTFAGSGTKESRNGTGVLASFDTPAGIAIDNDGNLYVTEEGAHTIKKVDPNGVVTTLEGAGYTGISNGYGTYATFRNPWGVAVDKSGNVFVADRGNHWIRKITPGGLVSTFAGTGTLGSADGIGSNAGFNNPSFLAFDGGNNLYVTDAGNQKIRKISPEGLVTTLAGSGTLGDADGTGTGASFRNPYGIAVTPRGVAYVADQSNHKIRRISPEGVVNTIAGSATQGSANGTGTSATFNFPFGLALDSDGNLYVTDSPNQLIRKIDKPKDFLSGNSQGQVGVHNVSLRVTDESNATADQDFTVTVNDIVDPVFASGTAVNFAENGTGIAYTAVATDGSALTYSLGIGADEALFKIEGGNVSFLSAPDFENPDDGDGNNIYVIEVKASDGTNEVSQTVTIMVTDVDDIDPVFTSAATVDFAENSSGVVHTITASDANPVSFSLGSDRDESHISIFTVGDGSGIIIFNYPPDFENAIDKDGNNEYVIEVIASDGLNTASQLVTITITDVDDIPAIFTVPLVFAENGTGPIYTATTNSGNATYSLGTNLDESLFAIQSGVITFKNAPDFENPADGNGDNVYELKLMAVDGADKTCLMLLITVTDESEDSTPPEAPIVTGIGDDTGSSNTDGITMDRSMLIYGTAEADADIKVFSPHGLIGMTQADGNGDWTLDIRGFNLPEMTTSAAAEAIDAAGNQSVRGDWFEITIDFTAPEKPVITRISDDTGSSATDGVTSDRNILVHGTAEPGANVDVFSPGAKIGTVQADANGDWMLDISRFNLPQFTANMTAEAFDLAGNRSARSDPFTLTIDFTAPARPAITRISDDTGSSATDGVTSDRNIIVHGTAEAGANVDVFSPGAKIGTVLADANGDWILDISRFNLPQFTANMTVEAIDLAGNRSATSDPFTLTIDFTGPGVTIDLAGGSVAGQLVNAVFGEEVNGLTLGEITVTGGTASELVQTSPTTYSFLVNSSGGAVDVRINADAAEDIAGNGNTASNQLTLGFTDTAVSAREDFTDLRNIRKAEEISVYPNPAKKVLTLDLSELSAEAVDIYIYDAAGMPVFKREAYGEKSLSLDVSGYTSGLYIVQCYDGTTIIRKKVMVKK